jgi:hypothetical protein
MLKKKIKPDEYFSLSVSIHDVIEDEDFSEVGNEIQKNGTIFIIPKENPA